MEPKRDSWRMVSDIDVAQALGGEIVKNAEAMNYSHRAIFQLQTIIEEAFKNAVVHGNKEDLRKRVLVNVTYEEAGITLEVEDEGNGFDVEGLPDCTDDEHLADTHGRGVKMIRAMTYATYNDIGNKLTMYIPQEGVPPAVEVAA